MNVRFSPLAFADLEGIRAYLMARSPQGAERVRSAISSAIDPTVGSKTDEAGLFRWPLRKYRYTIFYRMLPDSGGIEIARIVHGARIKRLDTLPGEE